MRIARAVISRDFNGFGIKRRISVYDPEAVTAALKSGDIRSEAVTVTSQQFFVYSGIIGR